MKDECCHGHPDNGDLATQTESQRAETDLRDVNTALLEALEIIQLEASEADESDNPYNVLESIDKLARAAIEAAK